MGASGITSVNFGAFPGGVEATATVTGQASILAGSIVGAWINPVVSTDHSPDEHLAEPLRVMAGDIVAGTGFTIHVFEGAPPLTHGFQPEGGVRDDNEGHRVYGVWNVAWAWV
jgi:hypothetical protein